MKIVRRFVASLKTGKVPEIDVKKSAVENNPREPSTGDRRLSEHLAKIFATSAQGGCNQDHYGLSERIAAGQHAPNIRTWVLHATPTVR